VKASCQRVGIEILPARRGNQLDECRTGLGVEGGGELLAQFEEFRAPARLAPEGIPDSDPFPAGNRGLEIAVDHGQNSPRWVGTGGIEVGVGHAPVLIDQVCESVDQELVLGREIEIHDAYGQPGQARDVRHGDAGKALGRDALDGRFHQLLAPPLLDCFAHPTPAPSLINNSYRSGPSQ
jgi:hypothetical protein